MKATVLAVSIVLLTAGCGGSSPVAATTTTQPTLTTEFFTGSLPVESSSFYSFTVTGTGSVNVTLASLTLSRFSPALAIQVGLGVGTPAGTGCSLSDSLDTAPALTAQLTASLSPGIYCVDISDIGNLAEPVNFAIRIIHP